MPPTENSNRVMRPRLKPLSSSKESVDTASSSTELLAVGGREVSDWRTNKERASNCTHSTFHTEEARCSDNQDGLSWSETI